MVVLPRTPFEAAQVAGVVASMLMGVCLCLLGKGARKLDCWRIMVEADEIQKTC